MTMPYTKDHAHYRRAAVEEKPRLCIHCDNLCQLGERGQFDNYRCSQFGTEPASESVSPMSHTCDMFRRMTI